MGVIWDLCLYIWHLFCGLPGMINDINFMDVSPCFVDFLAGMFPQCNVKRNIRTEPFDWFYLLEDGVYPSYKIFSRSLSVLNGSEQSCYTARFSAVRSSVKPVFGVLLNPFGIIARPGRLWFSKDMNVIHNTCVIVHNMVVTKRKTLLQQRWGWKYQQHRGRCCTLSFGLCHVDTDRCGRTATPLCAKE